MINGPSNWIVRCLMTRIFTWRSIYFWCAWFIGSSYRIVFSLPDKIRIHTSLKIKVSWSGWDNPGRIWKCLPWGISEFDIFGIVDAHQQEIDCNRCFRICKDIRFHWWLFGEKILYILHNFLCAINFVNFLDLRIHKSNQNITGTINCEPIYFTNEAKKFGKPFLVCNV